MKKKLMFLLALFLCLTACDISSLIPSENGGDDDESSQAQDQSQGGGQQGSDIDQSIFDIPESLNKLMAYGKNTGFDIDFVTKETGYDDTNRKIGMKGDTFWVYDTIWSGYRLVDGKCQMLDYDEDNQKWSVLIANIGDESQYNQMFASLTSFLYTANEYSANEGFVSNGEGTYQGRNVYKFKYERKIATYSTSHEYYVDKELGITLYDKATSSSDGDISSVSIEVTSFKTGSQVADPTIE